MPKHQHQNQKLLMVLPQNLKNSKKKLFFNYAHIYAIMFRMSINQYYLKTFIKAILILALIWVYIGNVLCYTGHICHGGHLAHPEFVIISYRRSLDFTWVFWSVLSTIIAFTLNFRILKWLYLITLLPVVLRFVIGDFSVFQYI